MFSQNSLKQLKNFLFVQMKNNHLHIQITQYAKIIGIVVFSLWFWIVSFLLMTVLAVVTFVLLPVVSYRRSHKWIAAAGFAFIVKMTCLSMKVYYDPLFDRKQPSVFCQNHVNLLDAFVAAKVIPNAFCGLMHAWQFHIPIYGWLMRLSKGIPVSQKRSAKEIHSMIQAAKCRLQQGFSILTFPEGHRTVTGAVGKFHRGVLMMARDANYPVVPVAVRGTFAINQKGSFLFKPGPVSVCVGKQISVQDLSNAQLGALANHMQQTVAKFVEGKTQTIECVSRVEGTV